jgi:DNA-directed RNA polymerase II subunit RPB3
MSEKETDTSTTVITLPKVTHGIENKGVYNFTLENANVSVANALRRVILSDIETVVINTDNDNIEIFENTTRFHNEILKQRLGSIPVHIKDSEGIENLLVELNTNNESDGILYVTTKDFVIKDIANDKYLTVDAVKKIFPSNKLTNEFILFTRLKPKISNDIPGESINLKVKFKVGTAKEDGMYNVVSTCAYGNTPDKVEQHNRWQDISEELETKGLSESKIEYQRKDWYTLQAKRYYIKDSFDFKVETIGVFTNVEIMNKACDNIIRRLNKIKKKAEDENLSLDLKATAMQASADIKLVGEDYTIGKVIEYILHEEFYKKSGQLSYVGFIKKHPHDTNSIIRIAFSEDGADTLNQSNINKMIQFACDIGINIFSNIKEYF